MTTNGLIPTWGNSFLFLRVIPGDPALQVLTSGTGEGSFTEEQLEAVRTELGINRPIYIQYGTWIWDMLRGDLNQSRGETCIYVG